MNLYIYNIHTDLNLLVSSVKQYCIFFISNIAWIYLFVASTVLKFSYKY